MVNNLKLCSNKYLGQRIHLSQFQGRSLNIRKKQTIACGNKKFLFVSKITCF